MIAISSRVKVDASSGPMVAQAAGGADAGGAGAVAGGQAGQGHHQQQQKNPPLTAIAPLPPCSVVAATTDGVLRVFDVRSCLYANTLKVKVTFLKGSSSPNEVEHKIWTSSSESQA